MSAIRARWLPVVTAMTIALAAVVGSHALADEAAGDRAVREGDYRTAVEEYREALEAEPEDVDVLLKLAEAKTLLAESLESDESVRLYEEAADHARRAIELAPDDAETHFALARALGRLAQYRGVLQSLGLAEDVREALDAALELDPDHPGALHALALWHMNVPWILGGRTEEVHRLFQRAIEVEPRAVSHRLEYGKALLELGDREAAREQLETALTLPADTYAKQQAKEEARQLLESEF